MAPALRGLQAPEAAEILKALKAMADVIDDPKLSKKVEETLSNRF
jgi:ferritin-like metal-binding protein YciE